jgi:hypothetical protein
MGDDFDVEKFRMPPEEVDRLTGAVRKGDKPAIPRSTRKFVKVPELWWEALAKVRAGGSAYRVAGYLLRQVWKRGNPVKLTNEGLAAVGVGRKGKAIALRDLRKAGLISVKDRLKKSPIVTARFVE